MDQNGHGRLYDVRQNAAGEWEPYDMTTETVFRERPALGDTKDMAVAMADFLNSVFPQGKMDSSA